MNRPLFYTLTGASLALLSWYYPVTLVAILGAWVGFAVYINVKS